MQTLEVNDIKFEYIADWLFKGPHIKPSNLVWQDHSGWIYAFIEENEINYIGITTRVLRSRLDDYSYIKEEQCARIREKIKELLLKAKVVKIYGHRHENSDYLLSDESRLIKAISPAWNRQYLEK